MCRFEADWADAAGATGFEPKQGVKRIEVRPRSETRQRLAPGSAGRAGIGGKGGRPSLTLPARMAPLTSPRLWENDPVFTPARSDRPPGSSLLEGGTAPPAGGPTAFRPMAGTGTNLCACEGTPAMKRIRRSARAGSLLALLAAAMLLIGCKPPTGTQPSTGGPANPQGNDGPIEVLSEAADVIETIKDPASLQAARPKLAALKGRFARIRPLLTTAVYISGEFPLPDPKAKAEMARQARANPEFKPFLAPAEALIRDPRFRKTYRRYNRAVRQAQRVPGASTAISENLQMPGG
jgi:hypothetical protein